jgi:long-chain acyl-CoA synthetase
MNTLPNWLIFQATDRPSDVAIRHKRLGIWQEKKWGELLNDVLR